MKTPSKVSPYNYDVIDPITGNDVKSALKWMGNTAAGLNKLLPNNPKSKNADEFAGYYNLILLVFRSRFILTLKPVNNLWQWKASDFGFFPYCEVSSQNLCSTFEYFPHGSITSVCISVT